MFIEQRHPSPRSVFLRTGPLRKASWLSGLLFQLKRLRLSPLEAHCVASFHPGPNSVKKAALLFTQECRALPLLLYPLHQHKKAPLFSFRQADEQRGYNALMMLPDRL